MLQGCSLAWVRTGASGGGAQSGRWNHRALGPQLWATLTRTTPTLQGGVLTSRPRCQRPRTPRATTLLRLPPPPPPPHSRSQHRAGQRPRTAKHAATWRPHASARYLLARGSRSWRRPCHTCGCRAQRHTPGCGVSLQGSGCGGASGWQGGAGRPPYLCSRVAVGDPPAHRTAATRPRSRAAHTHGAHLRGAMVVVERDPPVLGCRGCRHGAGKLRVRVVGGFG